MKDSIAIWKPVMIIMLMGIFLTGCHSWHHHGHYHHDGYDERHHDGHRDRHDRHDRRSENEHQTDLFTNHWQEEAYYRDDREQQHEGNLWQGIVTQPIQKSNLLHK